MTLCECGCGGIPKSGNRFILGHSLVFWRKQDPERARQQAQRSSKKGKEIQKQNPNYHKIRCQCGKKGMEALLKISSPEDRRRRASIAGKVSNEKQRRENPEKYYQHYSEMGKKGYKAVIEKNPNHMHKVGIISDRKRREKDLKAYYERQQKNAILANKRAVEVNTNWDFYNKYGTFKSKYPYSEHFNNDFKEKIRKRDNYTCQVTGMTNEEHIKKYGKKLFVHHWNYNKNETNPFYFVTVSMIINMNAESKKNRLQWIDMFNGIMEDKYCEMLKEESKSGN